MLSGTGSNRGTKCIPRLARFNPRLALIGFLGTRAWRVLKPDSSKFTWRQRKPEINCRLDFFLINQCNFCNIINAEILAGYKTDHSMITLQISLHPNTRDRGFWKLNTSFLTETEYVNQIKSTIAQTIDEYSQDNTVDPGLLWEVIK